VDRDRKRIGLSIRQLQQDPWLKKVGELREGMLVEGKITHLTKFGAFARIGEELEGLIHVSELSEQRVNHPKEVVHEGDVVTLRVIKIDPERRRIGLSLRKVDSPAYADLDWKMALAEEVGKAQSEEAADVGAVGEQPLEETVDIQAGGETSYSAPADFETGVETQTEAPSSETEVEPSEPSEPPESAE
jgi:small subunit ribosomal protein S1